MPADDDYFVTVSLARLLVLADGRLWHTNLVDPMLRAAMMLDWAASRRLTHWSTELDLDTTPTGNPAADALLARIAAAPNRPLIHWLGARQQTQAELTADLVARGIIQRIPRRFRTVRYRDPARDELVALRSRLAGSYFDGEAAEPEVVALSVLANLLGLLGTEPSRCPDPTLERCQQLSWLVGSINDWATERLPGMWINQFTNSSAAG